MLVPHTPFTPGSARPTTTPHRKAQLVDFRLRRIDGILDAVGANTPPPHDAARSALMQLLDVTRELFEGLAPSATAAASTCAERRRRGVRKCALSARRVQHACARL